MLRAVQSSDSFTLRPNQPSKSQEKIFAPVTAPPSSDSSDGEALIKRAFAAHVRKDHRRPELPTTTEPKRPKEKAD